MARRLSVVPIVTRMYATKGSAQPTQPPAAAATTGADNASGGFLSVSDDSWLCFWTETMKDFRHWHWCNWYWCFIVDPTV